MKIKIPSFAKAKILVVGDVMLDRYWHGGVERVSPEAPVPIAHIQQTEDRVGGAGNVALNICALGGSASLLGVVGEDEAAQKLEALLKTAGVKNCLLHLPNNSTISKLRVIARNQQLIRLDMEEKFKSWDTAEFFSAYTDSLADSDLVVFSDYGKGTLQCVTEMIRLARTMQKTVLVDPKSKDFSIYRDATVITPNFAEFEAVVGPCHDDREIEIKALELLQQYDIQALLVTRGAKGMSLIFKEKAAVHLPTDVNEVYDVTGAGDTVIATLGCALAIGEGLEQAMMCANTAAGVAVKKLGATAVSHFELQRAMRKQQTVQSSILDTKHLLQQVAEARAHGEKIIMTNGCFDLLHAGHVLYLEQAKDLGDRLIVAVNDDASVKRLKGEGRPINTVQERMLVLAALDSVDWVVPFAKDTPEHLIKLVAPDVLVKGGDYQPQEIAGADCVLSYGGKVIIIPFIEGFSSSTMLKKIEGRKC